MAERLVEIAGEALSGNEVFRRSWSSARPEGGLQEEAGVTARALFHIRRLRTLRQVVHVVE